jgi:RNA polymerase sigma factor FliA
MAEPAKTPSQLVDEQLVQEALPILDAVARRLAERVGVARDDLRSIGHFALTDIIRAYRPERGELRPYLYQRLRWAIIDGLRRETHHRRTAARASALLSSSHLAAAAAPAAGDHMPPSSRGHRARLADALREHAVVMGIKLVLSDGQEMAATASSTNPERLTQRRALIEAVREAIASLEDPRQRALLERHYFGGEELQRVAQSLGITKSWASRLHAGAIAILARRLRGVVSSR